MALQAAGPLYGAAMPDVIAPPPITDALDAAALFDLGKPAAEARIVVAMSGGVDSSVVAALAAQSGAEVIGITLQLFDYGAATGRKGACCAGDDIDDARAVSDRLGIAHYVFDHESAFRDEVVDQFADDYLAGRTPVPCIRCNMGPKFTDLLRMARELGADCLATGHYVQRVVGRGGGGTAPRGRSGARPVLFPVRHHRGAARLPALSARRPAQIAGPRTGGSGGPAQRGQARQPGHLLRARWRLCEDREIAAARRRAGWRYRPRRYRRDAGPPSRHRAFHRGPAARAGHRRAARTALRDRYRCRARRSAGRTAPDAGGGLGRAGRDQPDRAAPRCAADRQGALAGQAGAGHAGRVVPRRTRPARCISIRPNTASRRGRRR